MASLLTQSQRRDDKLTEIFDPNARLTEAERRMIERGHYEDLTGQESPEDCLIIKNVTKKFGKRSVLHDVSLSVFKDEIMVLIGENGAGKSMLIRSIGGCLHGLSGQVMYKSFDLTRNDIRYSNDLASASP